MQCHTDLETSHTIRGLFQNRIQKQDHQETYQASRCQDHYENSQDIHSVNRIWARMNGLRLRLLVDRVGAGRFRNGRLGLRYGGRSLSLFQMSCQDLFNHLQDRLRCQVLVSSIYLLLRSAISSGSSPLHMILSTVLTQPVHQRDNVGVFDLTRPVLVQRLEDIVDSCTVFDGESKEPGVEFVGGECGVVLGRPEKPVEFCDELAAAAGGGSAEDDAWV